ncbi:hypothetical protein SAMN05421663_101615 [Terribacillus halophilus]|uniref:Uncharacterized protein n=1 Tax=Terribacillus halophilus TaxID=361279 RepID=A0A1G6JJX5_9BACI|nr:hypothetical protein [Terribacillus halophilus]SDC18981.1 hypothetical protein SAMN05421663_101615 [Terribacillus halophilus]
MVSKIGAMYQIVSEDQEQFQAYMSKYEAMNPIAGQSDHMYQ